MEVVVIALGVFLGLALFGAFGRQTSEGMRAGALPVAMVAGKLAIAGLVACVAAVVGGLAAALARAAISGPGDANLGFGIAAGLACGVVALVRGVRGAFASGAPAITVTAVAEGRAADDWLCPKCSAENDCRWMRCQRCNLHKP